MHPQSGKAVRFEELPGGVIRAHGIAHSRMIGQLARAEYLSKRWMWAVMVLVLVVVPVVVVLSAGESFPGENLQYFLYGLAFVVVMGVGSLVLFGLALMYLAAPRSWALKLPAGTPMWSEFRREAIGIGWLEHFTALYLDQVLRVRRVAGRSGPAQHEDADCVGARGSHSAGHDLLFLCRGRRGTDRVFGAQRRWRACRGCWCGRVRGVRRDADEIPSVGSTRSPDRCRVRASADRGTPRRPFADFEVGRRRPHLVR